MERAPLRPVPSRPAGPVAPAEAVRYVAGELPRLDEAAAAALALVALVGRARDEVAGAPEGPDLAGDTLGDALFRARKALRRKLYPLPGSGWCERAERLISDRLDDALVDPGPARLEVHLANCSRCVEHERRLAQAHESLVAGFQASHEPAHEAEPEAAAPAEGRSPEDSPAVLRAVETPRLPAAVEFEELPAPEVAGELPEGEDTPQIVEGSAEEVAPLRDAPAVDALPPADAVPELDATAETPRVAETPRIEEPRPAVPLPRRMPSSSSPGPSPAPSLPGVGSAPPPETAAPRPVAPAAGPPAAHPSASSWTTPAPSPWPRPAPPAPAAWRSDPPRPLAARAALEREDEWSAIGTLVAVLGVAVVIGLLAVLLASGG